MITKSAAKFTSVIGSRITNAIPGLKNIKPEQLRWMRRGLVASGALGGGTYLGDRQYRQQSGTIDLPVKKIEKGEILGNIS